MSMQGKSESGYLSMSYIPPSAEMTDSNGYQIMKLLTTPGDNPYNIHTAKEGTAMQQEEDKNKRLGKSLNTLLSLQNEPLDEPVYTYIDDARYLNKNICGSNDDQSACYESIGEAFAPATSQSINKSLEKLNGTEEGNVEVMKEIGEAVKDNLTCHITAIHQVLKKVDKFIVVLDNVIQTKKEQAKAMPLQQFKNTNLESDDNPTELCNSLDEMKAIVKEIRRLTPPQPIVSAPVEETDLDNIVVTDARQDVADSNINASSETLANITRLRNIFSENTSGNHTYLFHGSMVTIIFLLAIGVGFITYMFMKK